MNSRKPAMAYQLARCHEPLLVLAIQNLEGVDSIKLIEAATMKLILGLRYMLLSLGPWLGS